MEHMTFGNGYSLSTNSSGDLFINLVDPFTTDIEVIFICSAKDRRRILTGLKYAADHFLTRT